jgi:hypothetical protein
MIDCLSEGRRKPIVEVKIKNHQFRKSSKTEGASPNC